MKDKEDDWAAHAALINRIVELCGLRHAEDMRTASSLLGEFVSTKPDDENFISSGDEGVWDTGFAMMVFAGTMRALFEGTYEVLSDIAEIPRPARRRLQGVQETMKKRHMKHMREFTDGSEDDLTEQD
jgi:hypothetical protein